MKHETTETERAFAAGEFNSQERAMQFAHKLERERDEMREAIKVSDGAIDDAISLIGRCSIDETPGDFHETLTAIQTARETLKPLLQ